MLKAFIRRAGARGAALRACTSGVAFVEFALSLPVITTLGLWGLECANFAMANLRVSNIAMLTADNAARVRDSIDETDVIELFTGAKTTGTSIGFAAHGRIILSSMEPNTAGSGGATTGQWIRWQRCDGAKVVTSNYGPQDTGRTNASLQSVGPANNQISAAAGTAVMVVEVTYDYQPLISNAFLGPRTIRYESAFNVRQRVNQTLNNISNATPRNCTTFSP